MNLLKRVIRLIPTLFGTIVLLVGWPWALVRFVGNPFPSELPVLDQVLLMLRSVQFPTEFWVGLFAIVLWLIWLQLVVSIVLEIATLERSTPKIRGFGFAQGIAGQLVARTLVVLSILGSNATMAMAGPLESLNEIPAASIETSETTPMAAVDPSGTNIEVARRDTFRSLAQTHLGSADDWKELRSANVGRVMDDGTTIEEDTIILQPGWKLVVPSSGTQPVSIEVEVGDHFWNIASDRLEQKWGRAPSDSEVTEYWQQLIAANNENIAPPGDPNLIFPQQQFVVPAVPADPLGPEPTINVPVPEVEVEPESSSPVSVPVEPATPAPVQPATPAPVSESAVSSFESESISKSILFGTMGVLVLGLLMATLVRHRRKWAAQRPAGSRIDLDRDALEVEDQVRGLSTDGEDAQYIQAFVPWLSTVLHKVDPLPSVIGVRAGDLGVEILLDDRCEMPSQFISVSEGGRAYRLQSGITDRQMRAEGSMAHPFMPLLLPVGDTATGELLIDFEQLGVVALDGPEEVKSSYLNTLFVSALSVPWAENISIVAIGLDNLPAIKDNRVEVPVDPQAWAESFSKDIEVEAFQEDSSTYRKRVDGGCDTVNTLVFVGSEYASIAQHLRHPAELADGSLTLVSASELPVETLIRLTETTGTLDNTGLVWELNLATPEDVGAVDNLLADAATPPKMIPVVEEIPFVPKTRTESAAKRDEVKANHSNGASQEASRTSQTDNKPVEDSSATAQIDTSPPLPPAKTKIPVIGGATVHKPAPDHRNVPDQPKQLVAALADSADLDIQPLDGKPSPDLVSQVSSILAPKGVEIKVLTETPTITGVKLAPKQLAIVTYISLYGKVSRNKVRQQFWDEDQRRAADNTLTRIRNSLGQSDEGNKRFPRSKDTYGLDDVGSDWARFEALNKLASASVTRADKIHALDAALALIEGEPAGGTAGALWGWLTEDPRWYLEFERQIVDAAAKRADLAIQDQNPLEARHAIRQASRAVPSSEELTRMSMKSSAQLHDNTALDSEYKAALLAAEQLEVDLTPETHLLYNQLCGNISVPKESVGSSS